MSAALALAECQRLSAPAATHAPLQTLSAGAVAVAVVVPLQKLSADLARRRADAVELARLEIGCSVSALCRHAGVDDTTYYRNVTRGRPNGRALAKLEAGLAALRRSTPARDGAVPLIRATYGGFLAAFCRARGLDPAIAHAQDPRAGATASPEWRVYAHARQAAIYLANTVLDVPQRRLAEALGLTPAAVCLALKSVEDRREDPVLDELLERLALDVTGAQP